MRDSKPGQSLNMPDSSPRMVYEEALPAKALRPFVLAYWYFRVPSDVGEIMHYIPLTGAPWLTASTQTNSLHLVGPRTSPLQIPLRGNAEFFGVHLLPGSAEALLGVPGSSLRDAVMEAHTLLGRDWPARLLSLLRDARALRSAARVFNRELTRLRPSSSKLDPAVMHAVALILGSAGQAVIARVAEQVGVSERHLRRRFRVATGLSPKELACIRRVRAAAVDAGGAHGIQWSGIAADRGYTDQAHLIGDFRRTLGVTPVAFMRHARRIKHVRVRR